MVMDKQTLAKMFLFTSNLWLQHTGNLSDIDSRFGDGDHGVTIGKIAHLMASSVKKWEEQNIHDFITTLSNGITEISGGSAGPLYGTLIGGLADPLTDETSIDGPLLKKMLAATVEALSDITKAKKGDKTMMDALIPAVEAAQAADNNIAHILSATAHAAAEGAKASEGYVSKFGRARSYGEKTIGTPDAGALSTALFFQGLYEGFCAP